MSIRGKIVVASGDKENINALRNLLETLKYEVSSYKDLKKLVREIQAENPDLLVIDADTVEGDSYELSKKIKKGLLTRLPIILMTPSPMDESLVKLLKDCRVDDYIKKPVSYSLLLEKVKKLLFVEVSPSKLIFDDGQEFSFSGTLAQVPLPRILYNLKRDSRTGILSITRDNIKKVISFEQGDPKFVVSNIVQECLGRLLVAKGRLTDTECEESLKLMKEWKKKQGETLIKMGLIEPYELDEALKMQARERLLDTFGWQNGEYKFLIKKFLREDLTPLDIEIPQIVLLGVRRHYTLEVLKRFLDRFLDCTPCFGKDTLFKIDEFRLATWDAKTFRLFDGKRTFKDVMIQRKVREIDVYHLVFSFYSLSTLKFKESKVKQKVVVDDIALEKEKMEKLNAFQILNVDYNAPDDIIKKQYDSLIFKYSLSKFQSSQELAEKIEANLKIADDAYKSIKDRGLRLQYLKRMFLEEGILTRETSEVITYGEVLSKGKEYLSKNDYSRANLLFRNGINVFPKVGLIYSFLGYTILLSIGKNNEREGDLLEEAQKYLRKGLVISPDEEDTHLFYGKFLKYIDKQEEAKREFKKVVQINPDNIEAVQELRLFNIRERKKSTSFIKWKK